MFARCSKIGGVVTTRTSWASRAVSTRGCTGGSMSVHSQRTGHGRRSRRAPRVPLDRLGLTAARSLAALAADDCDVLGHSFTSRVVVWAPQPGHRMIRSDRPGSEVSAITGAGWVQALECSSSGVVTMSSPRAGAVRCIPGNR